MKSVKIMLMTLVICTICFLFSSWSFIQPETPTQEESYIGSYELSENIPPCLQMYECIEKYAREYEIPLDYAYGIAYAETRYHGPFDWRYDHARVSSAGAVGPMQIMPRYAHPYVDGEFTRDELMTDIDMNVKASMRMLRKLYNTHKNWKLVFGAYNTGKPCINGYAETVYNYTPNFQKP